MIKIAVYGKGGIGKSTTVSNVAAVFASQGLRVMQIGCDPKADSTVLLRHGEKVETVLDLVRTRKENFTLEEMVKEGFAGVCCVEAGGPSPGLGCAGRGIIATFQLLEDLKLFETYKPDVVLYEEGLDSVTMQAAIHFISEAEILIIGGTSLAVYPAAGLLNYVPRTAEVYLIDPKPVDTHTSRSIHVIQKGASEGVAELKKKLLL